MSNIRLYTRYQPQPYERRMPIFWWVRKREHVRFILRELTSVFVAVYAVIIIFQLRTLIEGPAAYESFLASLNTPLSMGLHAIILVFVVFHSITWFNLAPKAMVVRVRGGRVPGRAIVAANYVAWIVISAVLLWFIAGI